MTFCFSVSTSERCPVEDETRRRGAKVEKARLLTAGGKGDEEREMVRKGAEGLEVSKRCTRPLEVAAARKVRWLGAKARTE